MFGFGVVYFILVLYAVLKFFYNSHPIRSIILCVFYSISFGVYCLIFFGNPGLILLENSTVSLQNFFETEDIECKLENDTKKYPTMNPESALYCQVCKVHTNNEIRHCRNCDTCIKNIDHHCVAFGKCIAQKNLVLFKILLVVVVMSVVSLYAQGFEAIKT